MMVQSMRSGTHGAVRRAGAAASAATRTAARRRPASRPDDAPRAATRRPAPWKAGTARPASSATWPRCSRSSTGIASGATTSARTPAQEAEPRPRPRPGVQHVLQRAVAQEVDPRRRRRAGGDPGGVLLGFARQPAVYVMLHSNPRCGGALSPEEFDRIVTWIDLNAPYYPSYASAYPDNLAGRSPLDDAQLARLEQLTGCPVAPAGRPTRATAARRSASTARNSARASPTLPRYPPKPRRGTALESSAPATAVGPPAGGRHTRLSGLLHRRVAESRNTWPASRPNFTRAQLCNPARKSSTGQAVLQPSEPWPAKFCSGALDLHTRSPAGSQRSLQLTV